MNFRQAPRAVWLLMLAAPYAAIGCSADDSSGGVSPQAVGGQTGGGAGQSGAIAGHPSGVAGRTGSVGPMPGLGMMMMAGTGASAGSAGGAGPAAAGTGFPGMGGNGGAVAGGAAQAGSAGAAGMAMMGAAGAAGTAGAAGSGAPSDGTDPTSVCMGGKVGMSSDDVMTRGMTSSRNLAVVMYLVKAPNKILNFKTTLIVPKPPTQRSTLFLWPGLQHNGGSDPGRVGNGVLQPVLTWGPSCSRKAPSNPYASWWISAMYVNISTSAAGPGGCAGGDSMATEVGDRLDIDFTVNGNAWTQTVTNATNMKKVDFTIDLKGQDQNWAIWDIETPASARPVEDTIFEKSVLTFAEPVTSCQPSSAAEVDYFSAPVLSTDGKHCCFDKIILKHMRN